MRTSRSRNSPSTGPRTGKPRPDLLASTLAISNGTIDPSPRVIARAVRRVPRARLGDLDRLLGQRERVRRTVALGEARSTRRIVSSTLHADLDLVDDEQLAGSALRRPPGLQRGLGVIGTERDRALQHRRAVALVRLDRGRDVAGGGDRRLDLLALHDHRAEVAADATTLEPGVAPELDAERVELAEVGRSLDRRAGQPERRRGVAVVDAGVPVVRLVLQHLDRRRATVR